MPIPIIQGGVPSCLGARHRGAAWAVTPLADPPSWPFRVLPGSDAVEGARQGARTRGTSAGAARRWRGLEPPKVVPTTTVPSSPRLGRYACGHQRLGVPRHLRPWLEPKQAGQGPAQLAGLVKEPSPTHGEAPSSRAQGTRALLKVFMQGAGHHCWCAAQTSVGQRVRPTQGMPLTTPCPSPSVRSTCLRTVPCPSA